MRFDAKKNSLRIDNSDINRTIQGGNSKQSNNMQIRSPTVPQENQ